MLAAALIDSLFQTVGQQLPLRRVAPTAARTVSARHAHRSRQTRASTSRCSTPAATCSPTPPASPPRRAQSRPARSALGAGPRGPSLRPRQRAAATARRGDRLRDRVPGAVTAPRSWSPASAPTRSQRFLSGELQRIPGVKGAHNYLVDGRGTVLGVDQPGSIPSATCSASRPSVRRCAELGRRRRPLLRPGPDRQLDLADPALRRPDGPLFASVSGLRKWVPWIDLRRVRPRRAARARARSPGAARGRRRSTTPTQQLGRRQRPARRGQRGARAAGRRSSRAPTTSSSSSPRSPPMTCRSRCARCARSPSR